MLKIIPDEYDTNLSLNDFFAKAASLALNDIQTTTPVNYVDEIDFLAGGSTLDHVKKSSEGCKTPLAISNVLKDLTNKAQLAQIVPEEYKGLSIKYACFYFFAPYLRFDLSEIMASPLICNCYDYAASRILAL